jgi:ankyrin repeat protein
MSSSGSTNDDGLFERAMRVICQSPPVATLLVEMLGACPSRAARTKLLARVDGGYCTLLRRACRMGNLAAARALCAAGAIVEQIDRHGVTALMYACFYGHLEIVRFLVLEGNATVDQRAPDCFTALAAACHNVRISTVRFLLAEGNAAIETRWQGQTSLVRAARTGHLTVVRALLYAGADVAPYLLTIRLDLTENSTVTVAAAAYDSAGAIATLIATEPFKFPFLLLSSLDNNCPDSLGTKSRKLQSQCAY